MPGQDERWIRTRGLPYRTADGHLRVVGPTVDITMERHEMLVQEMSHRIKNLFAVVGSIVSSAPKANSETEEFATALLARINALSRAYDLARKHGAMEGVDWVVLLQKILTPHCTTQQFKLEGPDAYITSNILTTMTLLIHELATNALKYGGFSVPDGRLRVSWTISDDDVMEMDWVETVPNFSTSEPANGFGSRLVGLAVQQLQGTMDQSFTEDGLALRLTFKLP